MDRVNPTAHRQRLVGMLAGRWTLPVLAELEGGGRRYQDLHDALGDISYKMLTETLRRAERDGLIARHLDNGRIETATLYELTTLGRSLEAPLAAMADWVDTNWRAVEAARRHWERLRRTSV
jgi:DNA-binding HxlR family transcriptional regulator